MKKTEEFTVEVRISSQDLADAKGSSTVREGNKRPRYQKWVAVKAADRGFWYVRFRQLTIPKRMVASVMDSIREKLRKEEEK